MNETTKGIISFLGLQWTPKSHVLYLAVNLNKTQEAEKASNPPSPFKYLCSSCCLQYHAMRSGGDYGVEILNKVTTIGQIHRSLLSFSPSTLAQEKLLLSIKNADFLRQFNKHRKWWANSSEEGHSLLWHRGQHGKLHTAQYKPTTGLLIRFKSKFRPFCIPALAFLPTTGSEWLLMEMLLDSGDW